MKLSDRVMSPPLDRKRPGRSPALVAVPTPNPNPLPPELPILDYHDAVRVVPNLTRFRVRVLIEEPPEAKPFSIEHPAALADLLWQASQGVQQEQMMVVYADAQHNALGWQKSFVGASDRITVEPRLILQTGLLVGAASFALGHNHPSGDPTPSADDILFTQRMRKAADTVGLRMLDHMIIGDDNRWVSLRRRGQC